MNNTEMNKELKKMQQTPFKDVVSELVKSNSFTEKINVIIDNEHDNRDRYQLAGAHVEINDTIDTAKSNLLEIIGKVITENLFLVQQKDFDSKGSGNLNSDKYEFDSQSEDNNKMTLLSRNNLEFFINKKDKDGKYVHDRDDMVYHSYSFDSEENIFKEVDTSKITLHFNKIKESPFSLIHNDDKNINLLVFAVYVYFD